MVLYLIKTIPFLRRWYFNGPGPAYMQQKLQPFQAYIQAENKVLDIGSGGGLATHTLRQQGLDVTSLDIQSGGYDASVQPLVYDGKTMPFEAESFDTGLLLTVLHHIEKPEPVLQEALRTCKRVMIIEDVYSNFFQKRLTFLADGFVNAFYSPCPHTNKSDAEWKACFDRLGARLLHVEYKRLLLFFKQAYYVVEKS